MPYLDSNRKKYFYFEHLQKAGLFHGIFTRLGGVSPDPWGSLNTGSKVGDAPVRVLENLSAAARALGRDPASLASVRQVHGNDVYQVDQPPGSDVLRKQLDAFTAGDEGAIPDSERFPRADAMITRSPNVTLFMRFADCVPIVLLDPVLNAAGIVHAGWRGTVARVAARCVEDMQRAFGSAPSDILAGIGPSICANHYEVGEEVSDQAFVAFGSEAERTLQRADGRWHFDLWEANRLVLEEAGVRQIETAGECTFSRPDLWYSHRGEKGRTGRFVALVGLGAK